MTTTTTVVAAAAASTGWQPSDTIAIGALVVAIVVPVVTLRYQERARHDEHEETRRREAALVVGPVLEFLSDCTPSLIVVDPTAAARRVPQLKDRLAQDLRPPLLAIAAASPEPLSDMAYELVKALLKLMDKSGTFALAQTSGTSKDAIPPLRAQAEEALEEATTKFAKLTQAIKPTARRPSLWRRLRRGEG